MRYYVVIDTWCDGWVPFTHEEHEDRTRTVVTYATEREAQAEIDDYLNTYRAEIGEEPNEDELGIESYDESLGEPALAPGQV